MVSETKIKCFEFEFECTQKWTDMEATDNSKIRHCGHCDKDVLLCKNEDEWEEAVIQGRCVALVEMKYKIPKESSANVRVVGFPRIK